MDVVTENPIFSGRFFLPHLSVFEIRASHPIRWIYSTLVFFLLLPTSPPCAAAPKPVVCRRPTPLACRAPTRPATPLRCCYRGVLRCSCCCRRVLPLLLPLCVVQAVEPCAAATAVETRAAAGTAPAHAAAGEEKLTSSEKNSSTFSFQYFQHFMFLISTFVFYNFNILKAKC